MGEGGGGNRRTVNAEIAKQDADLPRIEIDSTPTVVVRAESLVHFSQHMDALERRYRTSPLKISVTGLPRSAWLVVVILIQTADPPTVISRIPMVLLNVE